MYLPFYYLNCHESYWNRNNVFILLNHHLSCPHEQASIIILMTILIWQCWTNCCCCVPVFSQSTITNGTRSKNQTIGDGVIIRTFEDNTSIEMAFKVTLLIQFAKNHFLRHPMLVLEMMLRFKDISRCKSGSYHISVEHFLYNFHQNNMERPQKETHRNCQNLSADTCLYTHSLALRL